MSSRLRIIAFIALLLPFTSAIAQKAQVQFINNSPDFQLKTLDIWLNDTLFVDDLKYHDATTTIDVGTWSSRFVVRDSNSTQTSNAHKTLNINLEAGKRYVFVITGVVNPDKFGNLDNIDLRIEQVPDPVALSPDTAKIDMVFGHGAPEYEHTDLFLRHYTMLVDDMIFRDFSQHILIDPEHFIFDLVDGFDVNLRYGAYDADLTSYKGQAMVVVWSGSRGQPAASPYSLRMIGVLPDGTVVDFPIFTYEVAMTQIVHNSPDPLLSTVDIWFGGKKIADDISFREATPMLYLNAEFGGELLVVDKDALTASQPLIQPLPVAIQGGMSFTVFITGVRDETKYVPNPDGRFIEPQVIQLDETRHVSRDAGLTNLGFLNLTSDFPAITVLNHDAGEIVGNLSYTDIAPYQTLDPENIVIDLAPTSDPADVWATFFADLTSFNSRAGVVFTSGFYDVNANNSGPALGLFCVFPSGEVVEFPRYIPPEAKMQFVHNSPDPALATMDVYIDDELFIDDLGFREATRFIDVPADAEVTFAFAPGNSTGPGNAIYTEPYAPVDEESYVLILQGVSDVNGYEDNPNGRDRSLKMNIRSGLPLGGIAANKVELNFLPGAMDQGSIDLRTRQTGMLFQNTTYGGWGLSTTVQPTSYITDINNSGDTTDIFDSYITNFSSFAGSFITLFTSGFVTPSANNNGPDFGLFGVFPDGRVFRYYEYVAPEAQMQFIHNAPDPDLLELDIYIDGALVADNMIFRSATEFLSIPAGEEVIVDIARWDAAGPGEALISFKGTYTDREAYLTMFHGVRNTGDFVPNPDGADIAFSVDTLSDATTFASFLDEIEINAVNGVPDLPAIDIIERDGASWYDDLEYGKQTGYITTPLVNALYDITDGNDPATIYGSYEIDLSPYGGKSGVLFFSGFFDPETNMGGFPLGLFMAFPDGTVIEFTHEEPKFARLQFIHNSADHSIPVVDVYVNGEKLFDDVPYLSATDYIDVPAEEDVEIAVARMESEDADKPLFAGMFNFMQGSQNFAMLNGLSETGLFLPNPEQLPTDLNIIHYPDVRFQSTDPSLVEFLFVNGITDLPALSLLIEGGNPIFEGVPYNELRDYSPVEIDKHVFQLTLSNDPDSTIARFDGDVEDIKGLATMVFTSGFHDMTDNDNSPNELSMQAVFSNGTVIPFDKLQPISVGYPPAVGEWNMSVAPNPAVNGTLIRYKLDQRTNVSFTVYDQLGRTKLKYDAGIQSPGSHVYPMNLAGIQSGTYIVVMKTADGIATNNISVVR